MKNLPVLVPDEKWHSLSDFINQMKGTEFSEEEISRDNIIKSFRFLSEKKDADHRMSDNDTWRRNIEIMRIFYALEHDKHVDDENKILHDGLMCRYTRVVPSGLIRASIQALIEFGPEWILKSDYQYLCDKHGFNKEFDVVQEIRLQQKVLA